MAIQPYTYQPFYEMLQINEFNQGGTELFEGSVMVPEHPGPEVLQATTFGIVISKSPRKTTNIYTGRKQKQEHQRTLGESGRKVNTWIHSNVYEGQWKKGSKKGLGK